jgi:hypothetical protein
MKCNCCGEEQDEMYAHCKKCKCGTFEIIIQHHKAIIQCNKCKSILGKMLHKIKDNNL